MNMLNHLFEPRHIEALGWTLLHSLWQLSLIATLAALTLALLRARSAAARYAVACAFLLAMVLAPAATRFYVLPPPPTSHTLAPVTPAPIAEASAPSISPTVTVTIPAEPARTSIPASAAPLTLAEQVRAWFPLAIMLYLAGILLLSIRLAVGFCRLSKLTLRITPITGSLRARFLELCTHLGLPHTIRLVESALVQVPTLLGSLKPMILMPASMLSGLTPNQLSAILAHELAHIRRHDFLINLFQSIIDTLLFYHPAAWWLSARIRQERENACDDLAVALCGNRYEYANALATMESLRVPGVFSLAARSGALLPRIRRLLATPKPGPRRMNMFATSAGIFLLAATCIYVGCSLQSPSQSSSKDTSKVDPKAPRIVVESRTLVVSNNFLDDFRFGWNLALPADSATVASQSTSVPGSLAGKKLRATIIDKWTLDLILNATQADRRTTTVFSPGLVIPAGQTGKIPLMAPTPYVSAYERDEDAQWNPRFSNAFSGFLLHLTPSLSSDSRSVVGIFGVTNRQLQRINHVPAPGVPVGMNASIDIPILTEETSSVNTMITIPTDGILLIDCGEFLSSDNTKRHVLGLVRPMITDSPTASPSVLGPSLTATSGPWGDTPPPSAVSKPAPDPALLSTAQERQRRVANLIADARKLYEAGQFREAYDLLSQAVIIDPQDENAATFKRIVADKIAARDFESVRHRTGNDTMRQTIDSAEHVVPYNDLIVYPQNWPETTRKRLQEAPPPTPPSSQSATATPSSADRRVASLIADANKLYQATQFQEAYDLLSQAVIIDPQDEHAALLKRLVADKIAARNFAAARYGSADILPHTDTTEHLILYEDLLVGGSGNWPEITRKPLQNAATTAPSPKANPSQLRHVPTPAERAAAVAEARKRLDTPVPEFKVEKLPLADAIASLREASQLNIAIKWQQLAASGVERNTPVTLVANGFSARKILATLLSELGGDRANLAFQLEDSVVVISTKEDFSSAAYQVVRTYDIRDMLVQKNSNDPDSVMQRTDLVVSIMDHIRAIVAPDSWRDGVAATGTVGTIREVNGQLVVNQTADNHEAVFNLLQDLRNRRNIEKADPQAASQAATKPAATIPAGDRMIYPDNWPETARKSGREIAESPANHATRARLDQNLKEIVAEKQGFEKVINFLRETTQANIVVKWQMLATVNIDRNTPVSVSLKEVPFRKALTTILSELGGEAASLAFTLDGGVIIISTKEDLNSTAYQLSRVFDIRDLLPKNANDEARTKAISDLMDTIRANVAPDTWRDGPARGTIGAIRELNGQLIVIQTADNQLATYNLLQQIRRQRGLTEQGVQPVPAAPAAPAAPASVQTAPATNPAVAPALPEGVPAQNQVLLKILVAEVEAADLPKLDAAFNPAAAPPPAPAARPGEPQPAPANPPRAAASIGLLGKDVRATELLRDLAATGKLDISSRPYLFLGNNQPAIMEIGNSMELISGYKPKDPSKPLEQLEPVKKAVHLGLKLEATAHLQPGEDLITLDLHFESKRFVSAEEILAPGLPPTLNLKIQKAILSGPEATTRVAVKSGNTLIIKIAPEPDPKNPQAKLKHTLLLITPHLSTPPNPDDKITPKAPK